MIHKIKSIETRKGLNSGRIATIKVKLIAIFSRRAISNLHFTLPDATPLLSEESVE